MIKFVFLCLLLSVFVCGGVLAFDCFGKLFVLYDFLSPRKLGS